MTAIERSGKRTTREEKKEIVKKEKLVEENEMMCDVKTGRGKKKILQLQECKRRGDIRKKRIKNKAKWKETKKRGTVREADDKKISHTKNYYKEITNLKVKEKVKIMEKNGLAKLVTEGNAKLRGKLKRKRKMSKSPRRRRKKIRRWTPEKWREAKERSKIGGNAE